MIILGIHDGHSSTAAILRDGKVVACASEERFTRMKSDCGHPANAINFVLSDAGVVPEQIDMVALSTKEQDPLSVKVKRETLFTIGDYVREMHEYWKPLLYENVDTGYWERIIEEPRFKDANSFYNIDFVKNTPKERWAALFNEERIRLITDQLKIQKSKVQIVDHHTGHAYYAYYASIHDKDKKAAVVTSDGWGDGCNATVSVAQNGNIIEIFRTKMCNLVNIYRWTTLLLGMRPNEHEYKVMGLAPYAKDYIREPAYRIYKNTLVNDGLDFKWNEKPADMYFYFKEKFEGIRFDGIAAGIQLWVENLLSKWISNIMNHTGADVLYYSGGLSMNVKANRLIAMLPEVNDFYVSPSGGDESLAMGAAFVLAREHGEDIYPLQNAYLGYAPTREESMRVSKPFRNDSHYRIIDLPDADLIAGLLAEGKIFGRCVGKMEFGARSLGNRAVLCDPSKYENLRIINEKIKFRDFWMPFTPSILAERADDYIVNPKGLQANYMTIAFDSTPLARDHIKAAIHPYDFTVRPQLVTPDINQEYYLLIKAFEKKTGIGALLNTSLNLHGSPIVCTVKDAVSTFVKSGLDGLILPDVLLLKRV